MTTYMFWVILGMNINRQQPHIGMKYAWILMFTRRFYLKQEIKFSKDPFDTRKKTKKKKKKKKED
jgi:hypothetical protein